MRFALVTHSLPQPSSNGGPMTCWAIIKSLLEREHQVTVFSLVEPSDPFNTPERRAVLSGLGVKTVQLPIRGYGAFGPNRGLEKLRQFLWPQMSVFHPSVALIPEMKALLQQEKVDAVFLYHYTAVAATYGLRVAPRMAGTGDLWHWPNLQRWLQTQPTFTRSYFSWTLSTLAGLRVHPPLMAELLNDCDAKGCFGAYDADWLRQHSVPECQYFQSPIMDACGPERENRRKASGPRTKPRILLGPTGLRGTAHGAAIRLFVREMLPRLESELGPEGFEVRVVGEGEPPPELAKVLSRPSITLCGRVEPADPEFLSADILLVPTPIVLGVRLRIITGMSFGCCIVAHTNEALNIPEMIHGKNALLASDGRGLAEAILRVVRDPALRDRLGTNARKTYEENFHPRVAAARIVAELEQLAEAHKTRDGHVECE